MKKITFLIGIIATAMQLHAQQSMTLYNMQAIPQRNSLNPALQFDGTGTVGFPMFSSIYMNISNSAFKITDFVRKNTNDTLYLDGDNIINKMKDEHNFISTSVQLDIFSLGFKARRSYFGFGATEKINAQFDYPKELMEFLWKGNAATLGKEIALQFGFNFMHYREYSFNYSIAVNKNLSLGTKLKYLYGMENASSNNSRVSLYTDPNSFAITAKSNININTSGLEDNSFNNFSMSEYAFGRKNTGYAMDFGAGYKFSEKIFLSASVLDIGKIIWNSHVVNYKSNIANGEFTYYGIDLNQFVSGSTNNVWQNLADTLTTTFRINPSHDSYQTKLPTRFYIGSNYIINKTSSFGLLVHGESFNQKMHNDFTFSYNKTVSKWLNVAASYSAINQNVSNFGLGLALKLGSEQIYFASDNIYGVFYPARTQNINFRAGINFVFSKKTKKVKPVDKQKEPAEQAPAKTQEPEEIKP